MPDELLTTQALAPILRSVANLVPGPSLPIDELTVSGQASFSSAFDVNTAALVAAALPNLAAGVTTLDRDRVAATFACHVEIDGEPIPKWADLSGMYRTADNGFIQFHCNFPHHREGVIAVLGCEPTKEAVQDAVLQHDAETLESELIDVGMIAARLRTMDEWDAHPHAHATRDLPLISVEQIGEAAPRDASQRLRVLDCSRVLAGPVAGMTMAAHGAQVLRIGSPHLPSVAICVASTGSGKRNAFADLSTPTGTQSFSELLSGGDVWIDAYRPGAFAHHGFDIDRVTPGSITVQLSAFDWIGPWAQRRGFDSIVQTTTGIGAEGMAQSGSSQPVPLPVQALDYCTGLLAAFAAQQLAAHQREHGGTWLARLSLLRTRNWLTQLKTPRPFTPSPPTYGPETLQTVASPLGAITLAKPLGGNWSTPPMPLGSSDPAWIE